MAKVRLLNGKPLMVGGKVALSDACCCGAGACPTLTEVTFDSVVFDGTCRIRFSIPNGSYHVDDVLFNNNPRAISAFGPTEGVECGDSQDDAPGDYELFDYIDGDPACLTLSSDTIGSTSVIAFRVSGMWRLIALANMSNGVNTVMFYGGPQANVLSSFTNLCTGTATNALTLPDASIWALIGIAPPLTGVASGGTATVT